MLLWSAITLGLGGGTVFTRSNKVAIAFGLWALASLVLFATGNPQVGRFD